MKTHMLFAGAALGLSLVNLQTAVAQTASPAAVVANPQPDQATLSALTPEQLRARAQTMASNPNRPTGW